MKISAAEVFVVDFFRANFVFVRLETTTGLVGLGEGTVEFAERAVAEALEYLGGSLLGEDPFEVDRLVETLNRESYWRTGIVHRSALSAVEAALLDNQGARARRAGLRPARRPPPRPHPLLRQWLVRGRPQSGRLRGPRAPRSPPASPR